MKPAIEECKEILSQLVQTDTCQPDGNEADIIKLIRKLLPEGIECKEIDHGKNRSSLVAKIEGKRESGGIAFLGHVDTVACNDIQNWKYDPHEARVEGDMLYGRGSADMKGGVTAMIMTARRMAEVGKKPESPVWFCFTADEENNGIGVKSIVEAGYLDNVDEMVICEPSDEKVSFCEKGALWMRLDVWGVASHASRPELGRNAVEYAIWFAQKMAERVLDGRIHKIMGRTSVSVTNLHGGVMTNIIPSEAYVELDIRTIPGTSHEVIIETARNLCEEMQSRYSNILVKLNILNNRPAIECDKKSTFRERIIETAQESGLSTESRGHYFYTDASQVIPIRDIPFVIAGPGDDTMAHRVNECISLESVSRFTDFYMNYLKKYFFEER